MIIKSFTTEDTEKTCCVCSAAGAQTKTSVHSVSSVVKKLLFIKKKAPVAKRQGPFYFKAWRCPTLTWGDPTLPSALSSFTSEFEMGSGGSYLLLPPDKLVAKLGSES